jgi:hypothetical protein
MMGSGEIDGVDPDGLSAQQLQSLLDQTRGEMPKYNLERLIWRRSLFDSPLTPPELHALYDDEISRRRAGGILEAPQKRSRGKKKR